MVLKSRLPAACLFDSATWLIATGFGIGLSPVTPATVASAAALLLYAFLPIDETLPANWVFIAASFAVGIWVTGRFATSESPDPRYVVWDEFVGMWVACMYVPKTWPFLAAAFLLFRLFDVLKPFPIRRLEHMPGGLGIMADDILAGIYANLVLRTLQWLIS